MLDSWRLISFLGILLLVTDMCWNHNKLLSTAIPGSLWLCIFFIDEVPSGIFGNWAFCVDVNDVQWNCPVMYWSYKYLNNIQIFEVLLNSNNKTLTWRSRHLQTRTRTSKTTGRKRVRAHADLDTSRPFALWPRAELVFLPAVKPRRKDGQAEEVCWLDGWEVECKRVWEGAEPNDRKRVRRV